MKVPSQGLTACNRWTSRWRFAVWSLVVTALLWLWPSAASAAHYQLFMRYRHDGKLVDVDLANAQHLPLDGGSHEAVGLYLRFNKDASAAVTVTQLRNLVVLIDVGGQRRAVGTLDPMKVGDKEQLLANAAQLQRKNERTSSLVVTVLNKFRSSYLCSVEQELVRAKGAALADPGKELLPYFQWGYQQRQSKAPPPPKPKKPAAWSKKPKADEGTPRPPAIDVDKATAEELHLYKLLSSRGKLDGVTTLFSYCDDGERRINWAKLGSERAKPLSEEDELARQKYDLAEKVRGALAAKLAVSVLYQRDKDGYPKNIMLRDRVERVILSWPPGDFDLYENNIRDDDRVRTVVDQDATLLIQPARDLCRSAVCSEVARNIRVTIDGKDAKGNDFNDAFAIEPKGHYWRIKADLAKYLRRRVELSLWLKVGVTQQRIASYTIQVEDLGLVTSFPLISEIVTLASAPTVADNDFEFKSSIPLSWAYNLDGSEGRLAAVTFPWMIGFNPRGVPRLADVIKVFPHATVLLPLASDADTGGAAAAEPGQPQLLLGGGLALVNTFTLAYGVSVTGDTPTSFFLTGVSTPDLVKLFDARAE